MSKHIFFVTGASGVGKTTLINNLKNKHKNNLQWVFLHFDSIGVPTFKEMEKDYGSIENWQKKMTFKWIKKMSDEYGDDKIIIFEGQVNLEFIKDGFAKNKFNNYEIILMECDEITMERRLIKERKQPGLFNQEMRNWLAYLRRQAIEFQAKIIDTSKLTQAQAMERFESMIKSKF